MVKIELFGTPQCRRYQKMCTTVQEAAAELGMEIEFEEINDSNQLSQSNPLDLPRLYLNGELIDVRNPPKFKMLVEQMRSTSAHS
ncbi:MAG: thioredoxin family protein [Anaerolineales bacterium]